MSNARDEHDPATDDVDDDELDSNDETGPDDVDGLSPIERLVNEGSDLFDRDSDDLGNDDEDD